MDSSDNLALHDFLRPGIAAADVPDLHPLLASRELLRAFSTLFHGGEETVLVRLLVLRTIGERGDAPDWSPQELRERFGYLDAAKYETVLLRLREHALLLWDGASQRYRISPVGRQALAAVGMLLQFNGAGEELAYVTAQLAAGQAVGRVGADDLQHLLARLNELRSDFDAAVFSGSEHRILAAADTLRAVWRWVEKGTEIVQAIAADDAIDATTHRVAQRIGRAQSAMLRQAGAFQRALNQLDRHRVHLGASGLSSSDVNRFLRALDIDALAALAADALAVSPAPAVVLAPIAVDVAEYELVEREREARESTALPPPQALPADAAIPLPQSDDRPARDWLVQLTALVAGGAAVEDVAAETSLADAVPAQDFAHSAYRFSLLGLLGDPGAEARTGVSAALARLPLHWRIESALTPVGRDGVAAISRGVLRAGAFDANADSDGDDADTHVDAEMQTDAASGTAAAANPKRAARTPRTSERKPGRKPGRKPSPSPQDATQ